MPLVQTRERAQQISMLAAVSANSGSVPITHMTAPTVNWSYRQTYMHLNNALAWLL